MNLLPAILLINIIFSLLLNFGCSFLWERFYSRIRLLVYYIICYYILWFLLARNILAGSTSPQGLSICREDKRNECREKAREFDHWRAALSNWLPFFPARVLFVSVNRRLKPCSNCFSVCSLTVKPSWASTSFPNFSFCRKFALLVWFCSLLYSFCGFWHYR